MHYQNVIILLTFIMFIFEEEPTEAVKREIPKPAFMYVRNITECANCLLVNVTETLNVTCYTEGGPEPMTLDIRKDGQLLHRKQYAASQVKGVEMRKVEFSYPAQIENHKDVLTCFVMSPALNQNLTTSVTIYVYFPPGQVILREKENITTEDGDMNLKLSCIIGPSNPMSQILWSGLDEINHRQLKLSKLSDKDTNGWMISQVITISVTNRSVHRRITCSAVNSMFPRLNMTALYTINIANGHVLSGTTKDKSTIRAISDRPVAGRKPSTQSLAISKGTTFKQVTDSLGNQKNSSDSITAEHKDTSTKSMLNDIPENTTNEKIHLTNKQALILPITGGSVGMVVSVVACAVIVYVLQRRRTKNRLEKPVTNYKENEYAIDLPTKDDQTSRSSHEGCQDIVNLSRNDARPEVAVPENEVPEYASVIPKRLRK